MTDLRFVKPTCPSCGEAKEGSYVYNETFDDLVCQSCRERAAASSPTEMNNPSPLRSARSRLANVGRALTHRSASMISNLASARPASPWRIP